MIQEQYIYYSPLILGAVESTKIFLLAVIVVMLYIQHSRLKKLERKLEKIQL